MIRKEILDLFRVPPGKKFRLKDHDTGWAETREMKELGKAEIKERARAILDRNLQDLAEAQDLLYADDRYAVLIVLQAMDAAGKDGTIKHVMSGVNPQGCQVFSFKKPSAEELDHNFLWRYMRCLPERGRIGIFNRSYYEDVLVVKVHPEILDQQKLPPGKRNKAFWEARYEDINNFERHLVRNGTVILKFFLNVSREEQRQRFLERLERAEKHWKFSASGPGRAGLLGPVHGSVRGCYRRHQHRLGALVRRPGRPQVGHPRRGRRHPDNDDPFARPALPGTDGGTAQSPGRGSEETAQ